MKMNRILLAAFAALFALTTYAQEWVSMDELVVKMPMGKQPYYYRDNNGYFKKLEMDCTFRFFMQNIPLTKIRLSKQKVKDQYVFSEESNGAVQGYWLVDNKKNTVQVGKEKELVVKLDKTPLVDGLWYEYDFGRDVYLRSISLSDTEFQGVEILLSADAKHNAGVTRRYVEKQCKPLVSDLIYVYSCDPERYHQEVNEQSSEGAKSLAAYGKFMKDLLYNGTSSFGKPQPLSATLNGLVAHALTAVHVKPDKEVVAYVTQGVAHLNSEQKLNLITIKELAAEAAAQKQEAAWQEHIAQAENALRSAKTQKGVVFDGNRIDDLYIDGDRMWFRRGSSIPPKGIMQKFEGKWYFASDTDNITKVEKKNAKTTRIEYTDGDYMLVTVKDQGNSIVYDVPEARLHHRQLNDRDGVFLLKRQNQDNAIVRFGFDNGDVFTGQIYFGDVSEGNFATNDLPSLFNDRKAETRYDFTGLVQGVLSKTARMLYGKYAYAGGGTTEQVSNGNLPPTLQRQKDQAEEQKQASLRKQYAKLVGKWKVTKLSCDSYNKCANGMGFSMTYQFFADGRYTAWLTYTAPAMKALHTLTFSVNGKWIVKDSNKIQLDTQERYQNLSFTYSGNDYRERRRMAELDQNPFKNTAIISAVEEMGVLGRQHIFTDNILSNMQFSGNTLNCNYYGENWNSCTMTKIK